MSDKTFSRGYEPDHNADDSKMDTIYRQAAIDAMCAACWDWCDEGVCKRVSAIQQLPSAQPKTQWIPCSERLPEADGRYLATRGLNACGTMWNRVYIINYSDLMGLKSERIWWEGNVGKSDFERIDDVLAWMPLPEPYRAERRVDERRS